MEFERWYTTTGKILYDPPRPGMKRRTEWWCIVRLDDAIVDYYRWWLDRLWWEFDSRTVKRAYHRPAWGAHVSVVRGEKPRNEEFWKRYQGKRIEVQYSNQIKQTGVRTQERPDYFWFIEVRFPEYETIRTELGLPMSRGPRRFVPHLTVARSYE